MIRSLASYAVVDCLSEVVSALDVTFGVDFRQDGTHDLRMVHLLVLLG